jgi:hypothetical protein
LALVLLDRDSSRDILLPGPRLAGLLKSIVDKALVITLILNYYFLASVYRNSDPNIQYLLYGRIRVLIYSLILEYNLIDGDTYSISRDILIRDN